METGVLAALPHGRRILLPHYQLAPSLPVSFLNLIHQLVFEMKCGPDYTFITCTLCKEHTKIEHLP